MLRTGRHDTDAQNSAKHGTIWFIRRTKRLHLSLPQKCFQKHLGQKFLAPLKFAFFNKKPTPMFAVHPFLATYSFTDLFINCKCPIYRKQKRKRSERNTSWLFMKTKFLSILLMRFLCGNMTP